MLTQDGNSGIYFIANNASAGVHVDTVITAAASPAASHASPSAAVCGHIVSRVPFLEHGKLPPQTFDYTAPPLLLCLLSMSYCLHAEMKVQGLRRWSERDTIMK